MIIGANSVFAEDTRYRVELLVLRHINSTQQPQEIQQLKDYSSAIDFLTPPEEEAEEETAAEEPEAVPPEIESEVAEEPELAAEPDPNALIHIPEMSEVMQDAWRRLRLSGPFRPEQFLAWEQGSEAPFPTLRVHDLEVLRVDDPYAELRLELEQVADPESATVFGDAAGLDALAEDSGEPELPDPVVFYRLDGTAMLKRTRFLHLELELRWREAVWEDGIRPVPAAEEAGYEPPLPSSYLLHELRQSRQVKTGRMEYFDGPVLGVLVFITPVEFEPEEAP